MTDYPTVAQSPAAKPSLVDRVVGRIGKVNTAAGAVIALVGTVSALLGAGLDLADGWGKLMAIIGRRPVTVEVGTIPRLPAAILPLLPSQDRVRWVQVKVTNRTREPLMFSVAFDVARGAAVIDKTRPAPEYTVDARSEKTAILDPPIQFTSGFEADVTLEITTKVDRTGQAQRLFSDTKQVVVLRREAFQWNLVDHTGRPLPPEFALASLRGWVESGDLVRERAESIRGLAGEPGGDFIQRWWRHCYAAVFGPAVAFRIGDAVKMPASGTLLLRTPSEVVARGRATLLETALLLHALRDTLPRKDRTKTILVAAPRDGNPEEQTLFVAWRYNSQWHAVDLRRARDTDFDTNVARATPRVRSLLEPSETAAPELRKKLRDTGAFVDEKRGVAAVDLAVAARHYFNIGER